MAWMGRTHRRLQFNDIGLMCDAAAGMGMHWCACAWAAPGWTMARWCGWGTSVLFTQAMPSPHAHYLCWRTGAMDRWEVAASLIGCARSAPELSCQVWRAAPC